MADILFLMRKQSEAIPHRECAERKNAGLCAVLPFNI